VISSLAIGIVLLTDYDDYEELSSGGTYAEIVAWVLIANSIVSFVGGVIGCFGLRLANRYLLSIVCIYCARIVVNLLSLYPYVARAYIINRAVKMLYLNRACSHFGI